MDQMIIEIKEKNIDKDGKKTIGIFVQLLLNEKIVYKFFESRNGTWKVIKNFSEDNYAYWHPMKEGKYIIMVQAKKIDSMNSFDYVERVEYINVNDNNVLKTKDDGEYTNRQQREGMYIQDVQKMNLEKFEEKIKAKFQYEYLNPYEEMFEKKYSNTSYDKLKTNEKAKISEIKFRREEEQNLEEDLEECNGNIKIIEEKRKLLNKDTEGIIEQIEATEESTEVREEIQEIEEIDDTSEDICVSDLYEKESNIISIKDIVCKEDISQAFVTDEERDALISSKECIIDNNNIEHEKSNLNSYKNNSIEIEIPEENLLEINNEIQYNLNENKYNKKLIKYILVGPRKNYCVGSQIVFTLLSESEVNTVSKYKLYIDNKLSEELPYNHNKTFIIYPTYPGEYRIEFYSKYDNSNTEYMDKKVHKLYVREADPIESMGISCDRTVIKCREDVTFMTTVKGGRNVVYEFYIFRDGNWCLVQEYSKKSYYTLMPFKEGACKLLVLAKNHASEADYDEFLICKFNVVKNHSNVEDLFSMRV